MAAILCPDPHSAPQGSTPVARPDLRLIRGGRSREHGTTVYWRRRLVALVVLCVVVVLGGRAADSALDAGARWAAPQPSAIEGPSVVVEAHAGDTLWTIARRVHPAGDVRPVVEAMLADRGTPDVQIGDEVRVPTD